MSLSDVSCRPGHSSQSEAGSLPGRPRPRGRLGRVGRAGEHPTGAVQPPPPSWLPEDPQLDQGPGLARSRGGLGSPAAGCPPQLCPRELAGVMGESALGRQLSSPAPCGRGGRTPAGGAGGAAVPASASPLPGLRPPILRVWDPITPRTKNNLPDREIMQREDEPRGAGGGGLRGLLSGSAIWPGDALQGSRSWRVPASTVCLPGAAPSSPPPAPAAATPVQD